MGPADQRSARSSRRLVGAARVRARLRVVVSDEEGRRVRDSGLGRWLRAVAPRRARGSVGVVLARDEKVRDLNRRYRRQDRPTDVLSFPLAASGNDRAPAGPAYLGDIVIARGVAARQALAAGHSREAERRLLALHGLLHLLGYDHHQDDGAMARMECRLRARGGLREGLIERAVRRAPGGSRR